MIDAIRARLAAATPGPWIMVGINVPESAKVITSDYITKIADLERSDETTDPAQFNARNDADFIANAPTDIAYLLTLHDTAQQRIEELTAEVARVNAKYDTVLRDISQLEAESKCRHPFEPKPCFMCLNINNSCSTGGSACKGFEYHGTEWQG